MTSPLASLSWSALFAKPWFAPACLALAAALFLLPGTASIPLMDRDEPRFAQATWEMMERGDWIIPYFNDEYRFDKPVLSYWWMRLHYNLFGKSELSARLHSVVAAYLTALLIFFLGQRFFSRQSGFLAGLAWLTCAQVLIHGRLCVADMPMLFGVTLSMAALLMLFAPGPEPRRFGPWFWALSAGLIIGFLAKGPVSTLVPVLSLILARFVFHRQPLPWRRLQPLPLTLIFLAGIGLWGIPALMETHGKFWDKGMGEHVVKRGLGAFNGRVTIPVVYYLITGVVSLLPWSAFLPAAFRNEGGWRNWPRVPSLLVGWFVAPFLIFGFYATQLPHYIMPGFPAFFLLLFRSGAESLRGSPRWFGHVCRGVFIGSLVFLLIAAFLPLEGELRPLKTLLLLGGALFVLTGINCLILRHQRWRLFALASVICAVLIAGLGATLRDLSPMPEIQQAWGKSSNSTGKHYAWEFVEPSLVFYQGKPWKFSRENDKNLPAKIAALQKIAATMRGTEFHTGVFLLREWRLDDQFESLFQGKGFRTAPESDYREVVRQHIDESAFNLRTVRGLNVARSSWVELLLCESKPATP